MQNFQVIELSTLSHSNDFEICFISPEKDRSHALKQKEDCIHEIFMLNIPILSSQKVFNI